MSEQRGSDLGSLRIPRDVDKATVPVNVKFVEEVKDACPQPRRADGIHHAATNTLPVGRAGWLDTRRRPGEVAGRSVA